MLVVFYWSLWIPAFVGMTVFLISVYFSFVIRN